MQSARSIESKASTPIITPSFLVRPCVSQSRSTSWLSGGWEDGRVQRCTFCWQLTQQQQWDKLTCLCAYMLSSYRKQAIGGSCHPPAGFEPVTRCVILLLIFELTTDSYSLEFKVKCFSYSFTILLVLTFELTTTSYISSLTRRNYRFGNSDRHDFSQIFFYHPKKNHEIGKK